MYFTRQDEHWTYSDGGRADAGFHGTTGDCVVRAIAIATGLPYQQVYDDLHSGKKTAKARGKRIGRGTSPRDGVPRCVYEPYLQAMGWTWHATMMIGSGCTTHLDPSELPSGRIICRLSKHLCAVVDGVIHDTGDPSRRGTRCVYGYFARQ